MIEGTSTAAAIWSAGCVGVAVAMGRLEIAVLISVFMVGIFYFVSPLKQKLSNENDVPWVLKFIEHLIPYNGLDKLDKYRVTFQI